MKSLLSPERHSFTPPPGRLLQRRCACGGTCDACRSDPVRRRASTGNLHVGVSQDIEQVLRSPGSTLDTQQREYFSRGFGKDLSAVRLHSDTQAAASARSMSAQAYAVGEHIVFGAGQYRPETTWGRELLAHELAHVVQQSGGPGTSGPLAIGRADSPAEVEADRMAGAVLAGGAARAAGAGIASPTVVARKTEPSADAVPAAAASPKPCPATHTIADDVYAAIGTAWGQSKHGEDTVTEQGARIVTDKDGKRVIRTGSGGGGSISLPAEKSGDTTLGTFHTHPYSKSEGSHLGVSLSGGDIKNFIDGSQGKVKYIGAGSCIFALDTIDTTVRDACKNTDVQKRWNDAFAAATGTMPQKVQTAVMAAISGCGLCHYKACRPDDKSAVPKTATLT
jgi:hypothetical protein